MKKMILLLIAISVNLLCVETQVQNSQIQQIWRRIEDHFIKPINFSGQPSKRIETSRHEFFFSANFSLDGSKIVTVSVGTKGAQIWDAQNGKLLKEIALDNTKYIKSAQFSPDSTKVHIIELDATNRTWNVQIWDVATGRLLKNTISLNRDDSFSPPIFSHNSNYIAYLFWQEKELKIFKVDTGECIQTITSIRGVTQVQFSSDDSNIVTFFNDIMQFFNIQTGLPGKRVEERAKSHSEDFIEFSPNGKNIIKVFDNGVTFLNNIETGNEMRLHALFKDMLGFSAQFSPDSKLLNTSPINKPAQIWDVTTGKEIKTFFNEPMLIKFSPDGTKIVTLPWSGYWENQGKIYDLKSEIEPPTRHILEPNLEILKNYFNNLKPTDNGYLRKTSLLIALDALSQQNNGEPIRHKDIVENPLLNTKNLFKDIPQNVINALIIIFNIDEDVFNVPLWKRYRKVVEENKPRLSLKNMPENVYVKTRQQILKEAA